MAFVWLTVLRRIVVTALIWAFAWGMCAWLVGLIEIIRHPDSGHVGPGLALLILICTSAVFGALAGFAFAGLGTLLASSRARVLLGAMVGAAAGSLLMRVLLHTIVTVVVASLLGAVMAPLCEK
jgi:hypothetical protein